MAISMLKIRRPLGRLIFNMGIAIPRKTVFLIETAPCYHMTQISTGSFHFDNNDNNDSSVLYKSSRNTYIKPHTVIESRHTHVKYHCKIFRYFSVHRLPHLLRIYEEKAKMNPSENALAMPGQIGSRWWSGTQTSQAFLVSLMRYSQMLLTHWHKIGDKVLYEPMLAMFTDAYILYGASACFKGYQLGWGRSAQKRSPSGSNFLDMSPLIFVRNKFVYPIHSKISFWTTYNHYTYDWRLAETTQKSWVDKALRNRSRRMW